MAESELLIQKRAVLEAARRRQALAQEQIQRYDRGRPLLDGVQVDTLEVAFARVREFPRPFNPSPSATAIFYDAVQNYIAAVGAEYFVHGIAAAVANEAEWGSRRTGWVDKLRPTFELTREQSLCHIEQALKSAIAGSNMNILWPNIVKVLLDGPRPGFGHIIAANKLASDRVWGDLAELAAQPEKDIRRKAKIFFDDIESRTDLLGSRVVEAGTIFRAALCDYRDGPGRWQQLDEIDETLLRSWVEIAGLDPSTDRSTFLSHHSETLMIAGGHQIDGMPGHSIGGLEGQIQLIEDNGGALPSPPERPKRIVEPRRRARRRTNVSITKEMLTAPSPLLIRTDFTDDALWARIRDAAMAERSFINGGDATATADVLPVDDPQFDGLTADELLDLPWPDPETEGGPVYFFVVDSETISHPEHPILALSLFREKGDSFRLTPEAMALVEVNLSIANLGFDDYAQAAQDLGFLREM